MQPSSRAMLTVAVLPAVFAVGPALGGGLRPDRSNQVVISGVFAEVQPSFLLVFSAQPLQSGKRPLTKITAAQAAKLDRSPECVALAVYGKPAAKWGTFEYSFGPGSDAQMPWNDGKDFSWGSWAECSPDVWDNLCIALLPRKKAEFRALPR